MLNSSVVSYRNVTDGRTDVQTTYNINTALCVASRGKVIFVQ